MHIFELKVIVYYTCRYIANTVYTKTTVVTAPNEFVITKYDC